MIADTRPGWPKHSMPQPRRGEQLWREFPQDGIKEQTKQHNRKERNTECRTVDTVA